MVTSLIIDISQSVTKCGFYNLVSHSKIYFSVQLMSSAQNLYKDNTLILSCAQGQHGKEIKMSNFSLAACNWMVYKPKF